MKKLKPLLAVPVLCLLLGLAGVCFAVNLVTPVKTFSEIENRYLSQMPELSWRALLDSSKKGFAQRFESYANDQFLLRDSWISLKSRCEALLGKTENNGIVYGRDGYLFEKYRSFDTARLERNLGLLEDFADLTPDINRYLMVVPASYEVLADKVPEGLGNVNQLAMIRQINSRMQVRGYTAVDVATPLVQAHADGEEAPLYYRTDHHWTTDGAWLGYAAFLHAAGEPVAITPDPATRRQHEGFWGTYYNKAKKYDATPDTITWYELPVDDVRIDGVRVEGLYDYAQLQKRDSYAMFLHANNGVTVIENAAAPQGSLLVIKDSYANCFAPFLSQSYSKVVVVDLRSLPKGLGELIETEQIEDVLVLYSFSNLAGDANFPRLRY